MGVDFAVADIDRTDDLRNRVRSLVSSLFVGVPDNPDPQSIARERGSRKHTGSNVSIATIALFHEYGTRTIPERSFIRSTFDRKRDKTLRNIERQVGRVIDGRIKVEQARKIVGDRLAADMRNAIRTRKIPQNLAKPKTNPALIGETDELIDSIGWRVG